MRQIIIAIVVSTLLFACGQNKTPQKELELKQKELSKNGASQPPKVDTAQSRPSVAAPAPLVLTVMPLNISGDLGQVTFSQQENIIFYYNLKSKKGKIKINGTVYMLDKYSFDSKSGSYSLSGGQVSIVAPNCIYNESEGADCGYGKFPVVTITLGTAVLKLNKVDVQDCPNY